MTKTKVIKKTTAVRFKIDKNYYDIAKTDKNNKNEIIFTIGDWEKTVTFEELEKFLGYSK